MSLTLTHGDNAGPAKNRFSAGRAVAAAELRVRIQIGDVQGLLDALYEGVDGLPAADDIDLAAYRARIQHVDAAHDELAESVERLTDLVFIGADLLLITIGRSICQTLARLVESANAHATALEDGA